ncbi:unnamed protein product [Anisakis simplex]|uniref:Secreted protein n=1 Tax=Anisakis simplex TaxID=6269 RepID=A0A0M3J5S8_ANISI|nr:unnamed protein product [Anisakis simplex]
MQQLSLFSSSTSSIIHPLRLSLLIALVLIAGCCCTHHRKHSRYYPRRYELTLSVRNHNVTDAKFFRLVGVGHTADFYVAPGDVFTKTYQVRRKGYWTLFVEFPGDRYSKSPRKVISRDSYSHWVR